MELDWNWKELGLGFELLFAFLKFWLHQFTYVDFCAYASWVTILESSIDALENFTYENIYIYILMDVWMGLLSATFCETAHKKKLSLKKNRRRKNPKNVASIIRNIFQLFWSEKTNINFTWNVKKSKKILNIRSLHSICSLKNSWSRKKFTLMSWIFAVNVLNYKRLFSSNFEKKKNFLHFQLKSFYCLQTGQYRVQGHKFCECPRSYIHTLIFLKFL